jgi:hypothetical protein
MDPGNRSGFGELSRSADGLAKRKGGAYGALCELAHEPSFYYHNNVWIGSSFTTRREALMREEVGVDKMMWGNDYPHREATWPFTREALRHSFFDVEPVDVARMLGGNALEVYPFDLTQLRDVAVEIEAPTVTEVRTPLDEIPAGATSMAFETGPRRIW